MELLKMAGRVVRFWSARTCPRFGTGRHVCQSESGDMSPHSHKEAAERRAHFENTVFQA
jgi:hypothetical protein